MMRFGSRRKAGAATPCLPIRAMTQLRLCNVNVLCRQAATEQAEFIFCNEVKFSVARDDKGGM